jgi:hypothetical protein
MLSLPGPSIGYSLASNGPGKRGHEGNFQFILYFHFQLVIHNFQEQGRIHLQHITGLSPLPIQYPQPSNLPF